MISMNGKCYNTIGQRIRAPWEMLPCEIAERAQKALSRAFKLEQQGKEHQAEIWFNYSEKLYREAKAAI